MKVMQDKIAIEVFRFFPEMDQEPFFQHYEVPLRKDWVILDALNFIKDNIDGTLSFRWSCRMGICGSCGMKVNGKPLLTCATFLEKLNPGTIRVEPLDHFPVIRDMVIDMNDFMGKLTKVKPWLIREEEGPVEAEYLQTPEQLTDFKQYSMCINCMLCYSACPVYGLDTEFVGPAAIALAQRYNLDSRDQGRTERREVLAVDWGIWDCTFVGECTVVCPKDVDPSAAIQREKVATTTDTMLSVLLPFRGQT